MLGVEGALRSAFRALFGGLEELLTTVEGTALAAGGVSDAKSTVHQSCYEACNRLDAGLVALIKLDGSSRVGQKMMKVHEKQKPQAQAYK